MTRRPILVLLGLAALVFSLALLGGCKLGGGSETRIRLMLTDTPAPDVAEVHVRIDSVEVLDDAGRAVVLIEGAALPVDIDVPRLARDPLLLGEPKIPAGTYNTIRLTLSNYRGDTWVRLVNGARHDLTLPRGPTATARLANGAVVVEEGKTTTVLLDFMAEASIRQSGGTWSMRPVVFAAVAESRNPLPGSLSGWVLDRRGRPIAPPTGRVLGVFLLGPLGPVALGEVSSRDGAFAIPSVLAGNHTLRLYYADQDWTPVGAPLTFSLEGSPYADSARVSIPRGGNVRVDLSVQ